MAVKKLLFAMFCTFTLLAQEKRMKSLDKYIEKFTDLHSVPSVPKEIAQQYMEEIESTKESDPLTGAIFDWKSSADYVLFSIDSKKGDMLKRYIHAIISRAYSNKIFPPYFKDAQKLVDKDVQILSYVLSGDKNASSHPDACQEWSRQWSAIKAELSQIQEIELMSKRKKNRAFNIKE